MFVIAIFNIRFGIVVFDPRQDMLGIQRNGLPEMGNHWREGDLQQAEFLFQEAEKTMYRGQEKHMLERIAQARALIKEVKQTKNVDLKKVQVIR